MMKNKITFSELFSFTERDYVKMIFNYLSSANVGISNGVLINCINEINMPKFNMLTLEMPKYMNMLHEKNTNVNFHVSGYDSDSSQAIYRVLGEMCERYASIHAHTLLNVNEIIKGSYRELAKKILTKSFLTFWS